MKNRENPNNVVDLNERRINRLEGDLEDVLRKRLLFGGSKEDKSGDSTEKNNPEVPADLTIHLNNEKEQIEVKGSFQSIRHADGRKKLKNRIASIIHLLKNNNHFLKDWSVFVDDEPASDSDLENVHEIGDFKNDD